MNDARRDIDDDKLYGRFELLARAIVEQAGAPDIIALQERRVTACGPRNRPPLPRTAA